MRAVVMRNNKLVVEAVPVPKPGPGEALVKTLACGICGTDLHTLRFADTLASGSRSAGGLFVLDPSRDIVMGHEFCAEILDYGPSTRKRFKPGTRVCSSPVLSRSTGDESIGYSSENPGGFGEMMRLTENNLLAVPSWLSPEVGALIEPMAVGHHAVSKARLERRDASLVIGCGAVGLSVIAALKLRGAGPIVAADFSQRRRELAADLGADRVIDPRENSPYEAFRTAASSSVSSTASTAPSSTLEAGRIARYFHRFRRKCSRAWASLFDLRPAVIFECVGAPGLLDDIMFNAPRHTRIVVAGLCMERDNFYPLSGIHKELNVQFVLGYTREEFATTLRNIEKGNLPIQSLITGKVGLAGVANAFAELASPGHHVKILVEPWRA